MPKLEERHQCRGKEIANGISRPDFAMVSVQLQVGQKIQAQPSAMASMDPGIHMKAGFKGGLKASLGRGFGGESMIVNTFTARHGPGEVVFAPGTPGNSRTA